MIQTKEPNDFIDFEQKIKKIGYLKFQLKKSYLLIPISIFASSIFHFLTRLPEGLST